VQDRIKRQIDCGRCIGDTFRGQEIWRISCGPERFGFRDP